MDSKHTCGYPERKVQNGMRYSARNDLDNNGLIRMYFFVHVQILTVRVENMEGKGKFEGKTTESGS